MKKDDNKWNEYTNAVTRVFKTKHLKCKKGIKISAGYNPDYGYKNYTKLYCTLLKSCFKNEEMIHKFL